MRTAQLSIGDISGRSLIKVEILGNGPRPGTAWVRALGGITPFTRYTHGGPAQERTALVQLPHLENIQDESNDQAPVPAIHDSEIFLESPWTP
jgi:hypothetical protein